MITKKSKTPYRIVILFLFIFFITNLQATTKNIGPQPLSGLVTAADYIQSHPEHCLFF